MILVALAFGFTASHADAMTAAEGISMHHFQQQCSAAGGKFLKVKIDIYACAYPGGGKQVCNYTGSIGYCYGTDSAVAPGLSNSRSLTLGH